MTPNPSKQYTITMALIGQIAIIVHRAYRDKPSHADLCKDLEKLLEISNRAARIGRQKISPKEAKQIKKGIEEMVFTHFQTVDSCRVFFSMFAGLVSDLVSLTPRDSQKQRALNELLDHISVCFAYTENEPNGDEHDRRGLDLLEEYRRIFGFETKDKPEEMEV